MNEKFVQAELQEKKTKRNNVRPWNDVVHSYIDKRKLICIAVGSDHVVLPQPQG